MQPTSVRPVIAALRAQVGDHIHMLLRPAECSTSVLAGDVHLIKA